MDSNRAPLRLLVTGGGTGGHVYPALSVLEAFDPRPELLWVGKQGGMEEGILARAGIPYRAIAAGGLRDTPWGSRLRNMVKLSRGFGEAWWLLRDFRPDVVLATGGYVTFPVGLAAWVQRIPLALYLPDIKPGWAVRALAPFARKVAITVAETSRWFGAKAVVTGYPVRQELVHPKGKQAARARFGLPEGERVLLVTGGSQGSHNLNEAVGAALQGFLELAHVIHIHGQHDGEWLRQQQAALPAPLQGRYQLYDYLYEGMADALLAADLAVARAGASVLGEYTAAGLPVVLVPLPIAGVNQDANARWIVAQGGGTIVADGALHQQLLPTVRALFDDPQRLRMMAGAMQAAAHPQAAHDLVAMLRALAAAGTQPTQKERPAHD